jgi:hypothetical protein
MGSTVVILRCSPTRTTRVDVATFHAKTRSFCGTFACQITFQIFLSPFGSELLWPRLKSSRDCWIPSRYADLTEKVPLLSGNQEIKSSQARAGSFMGRTASTSSGRQHSRTSLSFHVRLVWSINSETQRLRDPFRRPQSFGASMRGIQLSRKILTLEPEPILQMAPF